MAGAIRLAYWLTSLLVLLSWGQPSLGATITPTQPGASTSYIATAGPVACGAGTCTTTLDPLGVSYLAPNNPIVSGDLKTALNAEFPNQYSIGYGAPLGAPQSSVQYNVQYYQAINTGTSAGANFQMQIKGLNADNTPSGTLHWLQLVEDNYNFTGDNGAVSGTAPTGPGKPESTIDGHYQDNTPFYDVASSAAFPPFNTTPPANAFEDGPRRPEPTAAHPVIDWDAYLFLVSAGATGKGPNGTTLITFYDGVHWGWDATYAPLPPAWVMMLTALAMIGLAVRYRGAAPVA